jgi:hypothetical protein
MLPALTATGTCGHTCYSLHQFAGSRCTVTVLSVLPGKGAFGVVHLVVEKKTGQMYACKSISKAKLITKDDVEDVRKEASAGTSLAVLLQFNSDASCEWAGLRLQKRALRLLRLVPTS